MLKRSLTALTLTAVPTAALALPPAPDAGASSTDSSECERDADCTEGYQCEVTGGSSCACDADGPCDDCAPVEYRSCVPGPCESDADCADDLVCVSYEAPCAGAAPCSSDGECAEAPPCEPESKSVCAPRWVLPCEAAADCGEGFTCEPTQICSCSGGAPTEPADSGGGSSGSDGSAPSDEPEDERAPPDDSTPPPEGDCTCEPGDDNVCVAIEKACQSDGECPAGWSCARMEIGVACAEPALPPDGGGSGELPPQECEPSEPPPTSGVCMPRYGGEFDSGIPGGDDSAGAPEYESGTATPRDPSVAGEETDGTHGSVQPAGGCSTSGAAVPVAGLALLVAAMWRRRVRV